MRIAVFSDIHGNWVALKAVLDSLEPVGAFFGLGDYLFTSDGAWQVVKWMESVDNGFFLRGDDDGWDFYEYFKHLAIRDPKPQYEFVSQFPERLKLILQGWRVLGLHDYPLLEEELNPSHPFDVGSWLERCYIERFVDLSDVDILLVGGLHIPYVGIEEGKLIINPGSVGLPGDAEWNCASYMLLEFAPEVVKVIHRRVLFDVEAAIAEMKRAYVNDPGENAFVRILRGKFDKLDRIWKTRWGEVSFTRGARSGRKVAWRNHIH